MVRLTGVKFGDAAEERLAEALDESFQSLSAAAG
jgi:hypothetical protein